MPESVQRIRSRIEGRLQQLADEQRALEQALKALDAIPEAPLPKARPDTKSGVPRARRGENLAKILPLLGNDPSLPPRQISSLTGIDPRVVAATVSKLRRAGRLPSAPGD